MQKSHPRNPNLRNLSFCWYNPLLYSVHAEPTECRYICLLAYIVNKLKKAICWRCSFILPAFTMRKQFWLSVYHFMLLPLNSVTKVTRACSIAFYSLHVELWPFSFSFHILWKPLFCTSTQYALQATLLASEYIITDDKQ